MPYARYHRYSAAKVCTVSLSRPCRTRTKYDRKAPAEVTQSTARPQDQSSFMCIIPESCLLHLFQNSPWTICPCALLFPSQSLSRQSSTPFFELSVRSQHTSFLSPSIQHFAILSYKTWDCSQLPQPVTYRLRCPHRRKAQRGVQLPSQDGCNALLSRSSGTNRAIPRWLCVLSLGPKPRYHLSLSTPADPDSCSAAPLWGQHGGSS